MKDRCALVLALILAFGAISSTVYAQDVGEEEHKVKEIQFTDGEEHVGDIAIPGLKPIMVGCRGVLGVLIRARDSFVGEMLKDVENL